MKKIVLLFLFIILQTLYSKNEQNRIEASGDFFPIAIGNWWKFFDIDSEKLPPKKYMDFLVSDTIFINGLKYFVFQVKYVTEPWGPYKDTTIYVKNLYYRKDGQKIYEYCNNTEQLLYDFEADSGATWFYKGYFDNNPLNCKRTIIKKTLDTIVIYHECFEATDTEGNEIFITNIGPVGYSGFIYSYELINYGLLVSTPDGLSNQNGYIIFPNPASDHIEINGINSILQGVKDKIQIYNSLGKCVILVETSRQISATEPLRIDVSGLPQGVYYCKLISGKSFSTKAIVIMK